MEVEAVLSGRLLECWRSTNFSQLRAFSDPGLSAFPYGPTQQRATSAPLHRQLAILLMTKEMRRLHRSAVRGSALARVLECDMHAASCALVFLVSAESANSWRIRSVAEHGYFGLGHREIPNPKFQNPNPNPSAAL